MHFTINGSKADIDTAGKTLGDALAELDERAEAAGAIIIGARLNGQELDAEGIAAASGRSASDPGEMALVAEAASDMKGRAIESLLQLVEAALGAMASSDPGAALAASDAWSSFRKTYDGLFAAEEASFLDAFGACLNDPRQAGETRRVADRLAAFFGERLAEITSPRDAMLGAGRLFDAIMPDISKVPVRLQTGKDAEAMKTMVLVVELINKTVRLLPDFSRALGGGEPMVIGGKPVEAFYVDFNAVLKDLAEAFENKDGVLIGDLAEYEILPRLEAFFSSVREAASPS